MNNFFALIIGVGGDLAATLEDASGITSVLIDPERGGYLKDNVQLLLSDNATKDKVITAFDKLISDCAASPDCTVFIYYSGHANRHTDGGKLSYYLRTTGANKAQKEETMLNGKIFTQKINSLQCERLIVMLDCCHAAGISDEDLVIKGVTDDDEEDVSTLVSGRGLLAPLSNGKGKIYVSSCDDDEQSVILPRAKNSLFTAVALEVLNGTNYPGDEFIAVIDLLRDLLRKVPERVKPYRHSQRPVINNIVDLRSDFYVCRNGSYADPSIIRKNVVIPAKQPIDKGDDAHAEWEEDEATDNTAIKINQIQSMTHIGGSLELKGEVEVKPKDMKQIDAFFKEFDLQKSFTKNQKVEFVKRFGGVHRFNTLYNYFSQHNVVAPPQKKKSGRSVADTLLSALEFSEKLQFIQNYDNKL